MVKYLLILMIGLILLTVGTYLFTPYFKSASLTTPALEATPNPSSQSSVEGESLELDLTALDRDLDEADNLETEFNSEVNNF